MPDASSACVPLPCRPCSRPTVAPSRRPGRSGSARAARWRRMPISMTGLGIVILVSERTGSYARGRRGLRGLRRGQRAGRHPARAPRRPARAAPGAGAGGGAVRAWRWCCSWSRSSPAPAAPVPHLLAALSGVTMPNIGAAVRARWSYAAADRRVLDTAFALEAVNDEVVFIVGPTVTALLSAAWHPWAGLATAAVFAAVGTALLVAQRSTEPPLRRVERVAPLPHAVARRRAAGGERAVAGRSARRLRGRDHRLRRRAGPQGAGRGPARGLGARQPARRPGRGCGHLPAQPGPALPDRQRRPRRC